MPELPDETLRQLLTQAFFVADIWGRLNATADDVDLGYAYTLKPEEAIKYFESKGYVIGFRWHDVKDIAHAPAFTVAGVLKLDVLKDIRDGLTAALADGGTFREFADTTGAVTGEKGWLGKRLIVDEDTGELHGRQLTPRRLRTIFDTNIQSSYNAGRYQQQMANVADRPYFERVAVMDLHTRPKHAALERLLPPGRMTRSGSISNAPDGYGCRCPYPGAFGSTDVEKYGLTVQSSEGRLVEVEQGIWPAGPDHQNNGAEDAGRLRVYRRPGLRI